MACAEPMVAGELTAGLRMSDMSRCVWNIILMRRVEFRGWKDNLAITIIITHLAPPLGYIAPSFPRLYRSPGHIASFLPPLTSPPSLTLSPPLISSPRLYRPPAHIVLLAYVVSFAYIASLTSLIYIISR